MDRKVQGFVCLVPQGFNNCCLMDVFKHSGSQVTTLSEEFHLLAMKTGVESIIDCLKSVCVWIISALMCRLESSSNLRF